MTGQEYISSLPEDTPQHRLMKDVFYNTCTAATNRTTFCRTDLMRRLGSDFNLMSKVRERWR